MCPLSTPITIPPPSFPPPPHSYTYVSAFLHDNSLMYVLIYEYEPTSLPRYNPSFPPLTWNSPTICLISWIDLSLPSSCHALPPFPPDIRSLPSSTTFSFLCLITTTWVSSKLTFLISLFYELVGQYVSKPRLALFICISWTMLWNLSKVKLCINIDIGYAHAVILPFHDFHLRGQTNMAYV